MPSLFSSLQHCIVRNPQCVNEQVQAGYTLDHVTINWYMQSKEEYSHCGSAVDFIPIL